MDQFIAIAILDPGLYLACVQCRGMSESVSSFSITRVLLLLDWYLGWAGPHTASTEQILLAQTANNHRAKI